MIADFEKGRGQQLRKEGGLYKLEKARNGCSH